MASRERDDLPPMLPSMWRLCKLGYRYEPRPDGRRLRAGPADGPARRAAGAVVQVARRGRATAQRRTDAYGGVRAGPVRDGDLAARRPELADAAPVPRPDHHRARSARREAPGVGRDDCPPGAAGLPRPARDAARSGVRARSHVHVGVLDVRVDRAARRDDRAADVDSSGARAAGRVCRAHRDHVHVAARDRAGRAAAGGAVQPARAPPVHDRRPPRRPGRKSA